MVTVVSYSINLSTVVNDLNDESVIETVKIVCESIIQLIDQPCQL